MKLYTPDALLGRFYVIHKSGTTLTLVGSTTGYDTYEDAEAQLKMVSLKSLSDPYLILQVSGEFRFKASLVQVHATE